MMKPIEKTIETVFERKREYEVNQKICRTKKIKTISYVTCICVLLTAMIGGGTMMSNLFPAEDFRILLDINPSIEISVDKNGNVKNIDGLNEDGKKVIAGMELHGETTSHALECVINEVVDEGYISKEANSVLVSIEGVDEEKSEVIKEGIANSISETLSEKSLDGAIVVQVLPSDNEQLSSDSAAYGISEGKAQLIHQILEQNKFYVFEELSKMSIHELNLLRVSYYVNMEDSYESGTPVELAYIGAQRAKEISLTDAQISVSECEAKLECLNSTMIYCVEFETEINQYRYRINAVTGEILSAEKIDLGKDAFHSGETGIATVGENAALNAALSHAGMEKCTLIRCKYNGDWVDGTVIYNIFFTDGIKSGRYVVNARTGEILQYSVTEEYHDRSINATVIGHSEAKRIALAKDGLIDGSVSKYEMNLIVDGDGYAYELKYICNATRYTVKINAQNGEILNFEKNLLKDAGNTPVEDGAHSSVEG